MILPAYKAAATYVLIKHPIRHYLYNCRENSTNQPFLCKTNPISWKPKMNVNKVLTRDYENETLGRRGKNKPNQTQSNPISKGVSTREPDVAQLLARGTFSANIKHSATL
jgi:hypothetical protein